MQAFEQAIWTDHYPYWLNPEYTLPTTYHTNKHKKAARDTGRLNVLYIFIQAETRPKVNPTPSWLPHRS